MHVPQKAACATGRWPNTPSSSCARRSSSVSCRPGTPLRLDELARSLGMSISPIREAVRQLEALGLAKHVPHQGARVLDFDLDELRDLFEVRLALESLAVRRAAERLTDAEEASRARAPRLDSTSCAAQATCAARCAPTRISISRSTTRRSRRGCRADPPRVGPLRALPAGAVLGGRRAAGAPPRAGRAAARRVRRARPGSSGAGALRASRAGEPVLRDRARRAAASSPGARNASVPTS